MPVESAPVTFVETSEEAAQFISWLGERRPILAIDTETEGLRLFSGDKVRLVQFGDSQSAWVLSARRWYGAIEEALKKYQEPTAWANANFDLHALEIAGLPLPGGPHNRHDIQVMDHLLDPARPHALKKIGDRMWPGSSAGQEALDAEMRRGKWDWATIPEDNLAYWNYAGFDVVLTSRIAEVHWPAVNARGLRPAYDREMAVQEIVRRMEHRGLLIDEVYTASLLEKWQYEREELRLELEALGVGNPSAGLQVAQAMQATEKWDPEDWTETGLPKLDEKILKGIDSEISRRVLRYRRLTKWCKAYLMSFLERKGTDGRIHPSIHSLRARTGRWSITDPPLQTLPSAKSGGTGGYDIRRCIIVPESDRLWTVDYDSQELRIFASLSGDPALIHAFESGQDLHSYVAQLVYRDESIAKGDIRREIAKNCVVPGTRVLTSDLRWVPAEELKVGDGLLAFDENQNEGDHSRQKQRRLRYATVTDTGIAVRPTVTIELEDGTKLTATDNHMWLVRDAHMRTEWIESAKLVPGMLLYKYLEPWEEDTSKDAGWLAGMLDGEGSINPQTGAITIGQNDGAVFDRLREMLPDWRHHKDKTTGHNHLSHVGVWQSRLSLLGQIRPIRLMKNLNIGTALQTKKYLRVVSVARSVDQPVVLLGTSTKTYFAEGFGSHNTQYARLYGAGPARIAETANVTEAEVSHFIKTYDETFVRAGEFIKELDDIGRQRLAESGRPYVFSIGGRYIPANQDKIYSLLNYLIQGSAKDILSMKLIELDAAGYGDNIMLAVHDELLFEFDAEDEDSPRAVARIMEDRTTYAVPLTCEATGPYPDWGTKYAKH